MPVPLHIKLIKSGILFGLLTLLTFQLSAQCPQIIDGNGAASNAPIWAHCNGTGYTLFIQTNQATGAYTIDWGDGNTSAGASLVPPATISHTYPATLRNYNVVFTETGTGCVVNGLLVLERPVNASITRPAGSGGVSTICAPGSLDFINTSTDVSENTVFRWDFGDGSPIVTKNYTDSGQTNSHTYLRNTVNCNTVVTLEAENYCTPTPSFASVGPINIYDLDDAAITVSDAFLCYPDTIVDFLNTSNLNCRPQGNTIQRYEYWNFGNHWGGGGDSIVGWIPFANPPSQTYQLRFPGKGSYTVTMIDSNMCGQDTTNVTITIGDPPVAAFTVDNDTICAGERIRFFNNTTGGANISYWNFGDGVWRQRNMNNQNRRFYTPGDYTVYLAVENSGGTVSCVDTVSYDIHVLPGPTADFSLNPVSACDSLTVTITENSTAAAAWAWDFDDGTTSNANNPPPHKYDSVATYNISLTVTHANGCTDNTQNSVTVYGSPVVAFTPHNVCEGVLATFTDQSTSPPGDPLVSWNWNFGDGQTSTAQNPSHRYDTAKSYTLVLTVATANCTTTDSFPLVVEPKPTAGFTMSDTANCSPFPVVFSNTSVLSTTYLWDFGDGDTSTLTSPTHVFTNSTGNNQKFEITLIASTTFGCKDTIADSVEVFHVPNSSFTSNAVPKCGPNLVNFTNTSTGGTSYKWLFGDGDTSIATNPSHLYQNKTLFIEIYTARLVVYQSNGCTDTSSQSIVVYPEPIFPFQINPDSGCSPLSVSFPALTGAVAYKWYFGDGDSSVGPSPSHTYINNTTNNVSYTVMLIATSSFGCSDTNYGDVLVHPNPAAIFTVQDSAGCQPHSETFTNSSTGAINYYWKFGNGDTSDTSAAVFNYTYTHDESSVQHYTVQLSVETQDGCFDTAYRTVSIYPKVIAGYEMDDSVGCSPFTVAFQDTSTGGHTYQWDFGDQSSGSTSSSPSHTFTNSALVDSQYIARLVVTSVYGCVDSIQDTVLVHPLPRAEFARSDTQGCHPLPITFTNNSLIADTNFWYFGDGTTLFTNQSTVSHTYTNSGSASVLRTVELKVETQYGCRDSIDYTVDVYPEIIAGTSLSDTVGCTDLTVNFSDQSTGAQFFTYDFGDGTSSNTANSSHTYVNPVLHDTTFTVKYNVRSTYGCEDSLTRTVLVHPRPVASFNQSVSSGCHPLPVSFTNTSQIADTNFWYFGDGDSLFTNQSNIQHTYTNTGSASIMRTVELKVETVHGCRDSFQFLVDVYPEIIAGLGISDTMGCTDLTVNFTDSSKGAQFFTYFYGDGNSAPTANSSHTYQNTSFNDTTYAMKFRVESTYGCKDSVEQDIHVFPKPIASFTPSTIRGCQPLDVTFNNASVLNHFNTWYFGDGDTSQSSGNPIHSYTHASTLPVTYDAKLVVETLRGCKDSNSTTIEVFPNIQAGFALSDTAGCSDLAVQFTNQSFGENQYFWTFGDGQSDRLSDPNHLFSNTDTLNQTFQVQLKVVSAYGCSDSITKTVTVYPQPKASFSATPVVQKFPNSTISLVNTSSLGPWTYQWNFGDTSVGSTLRDPADYTYPTWGDFDIQLIVANANCQDTAVQTITIQPPRAVVEFIGSGEGCRPLTVSFVNKTIYGKEFIWNFGDGGTSSLENPAPYTYYNAGKYAISLTVVGHDGVPVTVIKRDSAVVYENATAFFDYRPREVSVPAQPVIFYNLSQFSENWLWDMGDGTTYTERNPTHYYQEGGLYTVRLISDNEFGCPDTMEIENAVTARSVGSIEFPTAFTPDEGGRNGGIYDPLTLDNTIFFPITRE
ncbi:PKD domain-containing protein [bacterium SCSIO 12741]|nr:PKD domain-containing protein [bacterium SCSIO 12741]